MPTLDADKFDTLTLAIGTMIDDLWLRKAAGNPLTRAQSVALVVNQILVQFTKAELAALQKQSVQTAGLVRL